MNTDVVELVIQNTRLERSCYSLVWRIHMCVCIIDIRLSRVIVFAPFAVEIESFNVRWIFILLEFSPDNSFFFFVFICPSWRLLEENGAIFRQHRLMSYLQTSLKCSAERHYHTVFSRYMSWSIHRRHVWPWKRYMFKSRLAPGQQYWKFCNLV